MEDRDLKLLLLALRDRVVDPERLAEAAGEWTRDAGGLMEFLAGRGALSPDDLRRLESAAGEPALPTAPHHPIDREATTDHPARGGAPAGSRGRPASTERYTILRLHQTGGLGQVWLARDEAVGRDVALKTIRPDRAGGAAARARFLREARVTGRLEHPSIVPLYDLGGGADPFYVMRFVTGRTLAEASADYHRRRLEGGAGALDLNALLDAFVNVCRAVAFAHSRGVLHRDLKGANVVVGEYGEVFLLDWGLARSAGEADADGPAGPEGEGQAEATAPGAVVGTPAYVAPEVAAGGAATRASDTYGLGAILYALLTGRPPYAGASAAEVLKQVTTGDPAPVAAANPSAPAALVAVCRKAMARDPAGRYPSADDLATEVRRWLADEPVEAYREPLVARAARWARRRKTAVVAAAVLLATAALASTATAALVWREQQQTKQAWQQADREKDAAARNADAAVQVVRDLSTYVESYELGSGSAAATERQRKERLDAALASYERLLALHPDDPSVRWNVARMHRMRANLARFLNSPDDAERSYQEAIRLFERLAADFPEKSEYRELAALTLRDYGLFLQRIGRHQEAGRIVGDSLRLYEEFHRAKPADPNYQRLLAYVLIAVSDRQFQLGRAAESEGSARRALGLYARLAQTPGAAPEPVDPLFRAMAERSLALALREQGRGEEALAALDRAVELLAALVKVSNTRDAWSLSYQVRAERAWMRGRATGRFALAAADLQAMISGWDRLIRALGENPTDLQRKGVAGLYCGRLRMLAGQRDAAVKDLTTSAGVLEGLVAKEGRTPAYRFDLGRVYLALGQAAADLQEAARWYGKARQMLEAAVGRDPENAQYRKALAELEAAAKAKP